MTKQTLTILIQKLLTGNLSTEEKHVLKTFVTHPQNKDLFTEVTTDLTEQTTETIAYDESKWQPIIEKVTSIDKPGEKPDQPPVHRIHLLKTAWLKYAAAVIIIAGIGAYLWTKSSEKPAIQKTVQDMPAPSGTHATITLADGRTIDLDDAARGQLAKEQNVTLSKTSDGQIIYSGSATSAVFNTLKNPRGSKAVAMTLADGSRVWLNSESTITYPAAFTGNNRTVAITGEAYFEIARDTKRPFKVQHNNLEVKVLGTHFNVNTYPDNPAQKITLLEGAVAVSKNNETKKIAAGQQAIAGETLSVVDNANLKEVMAWKNGEFRFTDASIETIMKEVGRWYDADIVYEGGIKGNFVAGISRDVPVSKILQILELTGRVHFEVRGRTIIVKP